MGSNKETKLPLPDELVPLVENMTQFQKRYCEYRARGLKQADAARKAGSTASNRSGLSRVGWNTENSIEGVKGYIDFLIKEFAQEACVSATEIINKLRDVYDQAMMNNKFAEANKAAELMGNMIGAFEKNKAGGGSAQGSEKDSSSGPKNNVSAFLEEDDPQSSKENLRKLTSLVNAENTLKDTSKKKSSPNKGTKK